MLKLNVGRLPSDTKIHLPVFAFRSANPGASVLVMAGVHGDEINGVEIVRRALASRMFDNLSKGSVVVIPVLNVYGFNNFSRDVPDGKDVNRSFPGSATGSMAARVAHVFTRHVLPVIDFGVDFHTGGNSHYNFPQTRHTAEDAESEALAHTFGAPFLVAAKLRPGSLRKTALAAGKRILVYEGGENLRLDGFSIEKGLAGLRRLLVSQGMLAEAPPLEKSVHLANSVWLRAVRPGMFRWSKQSGQQVTKGEPLGVINDPFGQDEVPVVASRDGYLIGHNNSPVVGQGDALFHLGF